MTETYLIYSFIGMDRYTLLDIFSGNPVKKNNNKYQNSDKKTSGLITVIKLVIKLT